MKRVDFERHLRAHGCLLNHHGKRHDVWLNPDTMAQASIPRHVEIKRGTIRTICRILAVPMPRGG